MAVTKKPSKLYISNHKPTRLSKPKRKKRGGAALREFKRKVDSGQATTIQADNFRLADYFQCCIKLNERRTVEFGDNTGYKRVQLGSQIVHLVDQDGRHFASVVPPPKSEAFWEAYQGLREQVAGLPRSAGAPTEALRGSFHTWHLMLSGQNKAHMDEPYWNKLFIEHEAHMRGFLQHPAVEHIRNYCSNRFKECFPEQAQLFSHIGQAELYRKHDAFLWAPYFASLAVNEEAKSISQPHRDTQDLLQGLAGVFSFGQYRMTTLNFAEARLSIEMPQGALCFFPSHVLTHFNEAIKEEETRGSLTMFLGHDVVRWIKYGGKAGNVSRQRMGEVRDEFKSWWQLFKTIEEKCR